MPSRLWFVMGTLLTLALFSGCTTVQLEYDRMTGTALPAETVFDGETVNLTTIYLQGDILLSVVEGDTNIAALTGPADPADPNQYDYINPAEIDALMVANRASPVAPTEWECEFWVFSGTCTQYHVYGLVLNHYYEAADGTRDTGTMGWMNDPVQRSSFVNYYKNNTVKTNNQKYLRSTAHELGHAFNMNHCDGDGATTIMNQTSVVDDVYTYEFSASSLDHLQNHTRDAVWPGMGQRDYVCPHVH